MEDFYIDEQKHYGRPVRSTGPESHADPIDRIAEELACYDLLDDLGVLYTRVDHSRADTIEACHRVEQVLGWPICKNLFLCNRQKTQFYLLMLEGDKVFKTKDLSKQLEVSRLSFAGPEDLQEILGLQPGSVTVLALKNDKNNMVQLVMDKPIYEAPYVSCHPCISTSTVNFAMADLLEKILPAVNHTPIVVDLPAEE
jgi:Ala-tRNA(Pro) deacylase